MTVDWDNIESRFFPAPSAMHLPQASGVYLVYSIFRGKTTFLYIGSSQDLRRRVSHSDHPYRNSIKFHRGVHLKYGVFDMVTARKIESHLISKYTPKYNGKCFNPKRILRGYMVDSAEDYLKFKIYTKAKYNMTPKLFVEKMVRKIIKKIK